MTTISHITELYKTNRHNTAIVPKISVTRFTSGFRQFYQLCSYFLCRLVCSSFCTHTLFDAISCLSFHFCQPNRYFISTQRAKCSFMPIGNSLSLPILMYHLTAISAVPFSICLVKVHNLVPLSSANSVHSISSHRYWSYLGSIFWLKHESTESDNSRKEKGHEDKMKSNKIASLKRIRFAIYFDMIDWILYTEIWLRLVQISCIMGYRKYVIQMQGQHEIDFVSLMLKLQKTQALWLPI